jgi:hypothetical protein
MFGWKLMRESELALMQTLADTRLAGVAAELAAAKTYIAKCENLIEHERERIDGERERADRIADSLFQSNGLPATSVTVREEQAAQEVIAGGKRKDHLAELMEIYGETESELSEDGAEPIPEAVVEIAKV